MSEMAPEQQPATGSANPFTRQIGPMPLWGWMAVALAVVLVYVYWRKNQSASNTTASTTTSGTDQNLVPEFVNQVYTDNTPPSPGVPGPTGPAGPTGGKGPTGPTGPTAPGVQANQYPAPTGLKVSALSGTSVKLTWNYITGVTPKPTSYTIAVYNTAGKLLSQTTVNAPDTAGGAATATVSGLPNRQKLQYHVWANGGKIAPPHASVTALD